MHPSIIEVQSVSLKAPLGSAYLLQDISFQVQRGESLGIIGPIGAGKTSLFRLLNRLSSPSEGHIYLEQVEIAQIPILELRTAVVLVLQEPKLLGMTVGQALAYPLKLRNYSTIVIKQRLDYWCDYLEIPAAWLDRGELELSLGQRHLVAIARGLIIEPQVLLLDEPTASLDLKTAHFVLNQLSLAVSERSLTLMMINHQLDLIESFTDRILWLDRGKIYQDSLTSELDWQQLKHQFTTAQEEWDE